jgi:xanthine dehydrogenase YagS FAD-binding subunit
MKNFQHLNAVSLQQATAALVENPGSWALAGGIDLLGEMKNELIRPKMLVNLKTIPDLDHIRLSESGALWIGALTTLASIESHPEINKRYPVLAQAARSVATPQIRNVGTLGGNLCQRPRCWYYRGAAFHCLRKGGKECLTVTGENQYNAILGGGPDYIVHPSDCAPALIALGANVKVSGIKGVRTMPLEEFFVLPKVNFQRENRLQAGDVVTEIHVPVPERKSLSSTVPEWRSVYLKIKERGAWDFALASVAVQVQLVNRVCSSARVVLGGVAPAPWRSLEAEKVCSGKKIDDAVAASAGSAAVAGAVPLGKNDYKVDLAANLVKRALLMCAT